MSIACTVRRSEGSLIYPTKVQPFEIHFLPTFSETAPAQSDTDDSRKTPELTRAFHADTSKIVSLLQKCRTARFY